MPWLTQWLSQKRIRRFLLVVLCVVGLGILLRLGFSLLPGQTQAEVKSFKPFKQVSAKAERVVVGFYPINVYELDIASNTYYVDTYIWFKWKGKIDPIADLEFVNAVDDWGMTQKPGYEKPQKQSDGSFYQILRVEGRFFQPFVLTKFPLDRQQLGITIENSIYTEVDPIDWTDLEGS